MINRRVLYVFISILFIQVTGLFVDFVLYDAFSSFDAFISRLDRSMKFGTNGFAVTIIIYSFLNIININKGNKHEKGYNGNNIFIYVTTIAIMEFAVNDAGVVFGSLLQPGNQILDKSSAIAYGPSLAVHGINPILIFVLFATSKFEYKSIREYKDRTFYLYLIGPFCGVIGSLVREVYLANTTEWTTSSELTAYGIMFDWYLVTDNGTAPLSFRIIWLVFDCVALYGACYGMFYAVSHRNNKMVKKLKISQ